MLLQGAWLYTADCRPYTRRLVEISFLCCIFSASESWVNYYMQSFIKMWCNASMGHVGRARLAGNGRGHSPAGPLLLCEDHASWRSASGCHSCGSWTRTPDPTAGEKATGVSLRGQRLKARTHTHTHARTHARTHTHTHAHTLNWRTLSVC